MKKILTVLLVGIFAISLTGCIKLKSKQEAGPVISLGGVFKTADKAETFTPAVGIASVNPENPTISDISILSITIDPQDHEAIYIGSEANGLFYSYDSARSWMQQPSLNEGPVHAIAIHPKNKCNIFVSRGNTILKSDDCVRTWDRVYFDTRIDSAITALEIDTFASEIMYAGNIHGDVLQSKDSGNSWKTVLRTGSQIKEIIIGADTRNVFITTQYKGVYATVDKGLNWEHQIEAILEAGAVDDLQDAAMDYKNNILYITTHHGILKTSDNGKTWQELPLITPPGNDSAKIYSLIVNPEDSKELYYGTATAITKTSVGGEPWVSQQLPTPSIPQVMIIDPEDTNIIYIGFKKIAQK